MNSLNSVEHLIQRWNLLNHEFCKAPENLEEEELRSEYIDYLVATLKNLEKEISSTPALTLHDVNRKLGFLQCDLYSREESPDFFSIF